MPTAVVTGANSGIGWRFAKKLINEVSSIHLINMKHSGSLFNPKEERDSSSAFLRNRIQKA
jgi:NAD(P)-dependent dehydrogenase (short-subunit alcohol dehydrogenase family)